MKNNSQHFVYPFLKGTIIIVMDIYLNYILQKTHSLLGLAFIFAEEYTGFHFSE